jgi:hypothetical protein
LKIIKRLKVGKMNEILIKRKWGMDCCYVNKISLFVDNVINSVDNSTDNVDIVYISVDNVI